MPLHGKVRELCAANALVDFFGAPHRKSFCDALDDTLQRLFNLAIPKPNNFEAQLLQISSSRHIGLRFRMLASVDFDDQLKVDAKEVSEIRAERRLAAKPDAQMRITKLFPN